MEKLDQEGFVQIHNPSNRSQPSSGHRSEGENKDCVAVRKSQKADREKLRRDRLNDQFVELGNVLDPDRPKNDKATILTDTVQLLKDLTSQVNKLKAEYTALTEESRELTQEKNDLREEKTSLKSEIENLNTQYQQRARTMYPWPIDHSVVMAPPSYPYPVPMPMAPGPIPMHPHMQPYPFYGNQNPGVLPNPCSTFVPYLPPPGTMVEHQSPQYTSPIMQPVIRPIVTGKQDSRNKSSGESKAEKSEDSNDVATNLELKTPGSATDQDLSSEQGQSQSSARNEKGIGERSSSSRCSSSCSVQDSSSNSIISSKRDSDS